MKQRSPVAVAIFGFITFGIYSLYWMVVTKGEMKERGADIPTAWLIIIPFVSIWWLWKYSQGVDMVTNSKMSGVLTFILLWLLGPIGDAIVQDSFNNIAAVGAAPTAPAPDAGADQNPTTPPTVVGG